MLADAGMGILSIRVVYWHYSVLQRKLSNKKNGGVALSLRCFTTVSYTHSDAADERSSVDLGGGRVIKKKKKEECLEYICILYKYEYYD